MTLPDRRAHLRAAFLAVLIGCNGWVAIPIGPRITAKELTKPDAREQVDEWMTAMSAIGVSRKQFEDFIVRGSGFFVDLDNTVSKPIHPVNQLFRTNQSWALFTGADRTPLRLVVRGTTADGSQRVLYRRLDSTATFLGGALDFRRVRGIYDLDKDDIPKRYKNLVAWIARKAFDAYPDLSSVEVLQEEQRTPLPWQKADTAVKQRYRVDVDRSGTLTVAPPPPKPPAATPAPTPPPTAPPGGVAPASGPPPPPLPGGAQ